MIFSNQAVYDSNSILYDVRIDQFRTFIQQSRTKDKIRFQVKTQNSTLKAEDLFSITIHDKGIDLALHWSHSVIQDKLFSLSHPKYWETLLTQLFQAKITEFIENLDFDEDYTYYWTEEFTNISKTYFLTFECNGNDIAQRFEDENNYLDLIDLLQAILMMPLDQEVIAANFVNVEDFKERLWNGDSLLVALQNTMLKKASTSISRGNFTGMLSSGLATLQSGSFDIATKRLGKLMQSALELINYHLVNDASVDSIQKRLQNSKLLLSFPKSWHDGITKVIENLFTFVRNWKYDPNLTFTKNMVILFEAIEQQLKNLMHLDPIDIVFHHLSKDYRIPNKLKKALQSLSNANFLEFVNKITKFCLEEMKVNIDHEMFVTSLMKKKDLKEYLFSLSEIIVEKSKSSYEEVKIFEDFLTSKDEEKFKKSLMALLISKYNVSSEESQVINLFLDDLDIPMKSLMSAKMSSIPGIILSTLGASGKNILPRMNKVLDYFMTKANIKVDLFKSTLFHEDEKVEGVRKDESQNPQILQQIMWKLYLLADKEFNIRESILSGMISVIGDEGQARKYLRSLEELGQQLISLRLDTDNIAADVFRLGKKLSLHFISSLQTYMKKNLPVSFSKPILKFLNNIEKRITSASLASDKENATQKLMDIFEFVVEDMTKMMNDGIMDYLTSNGGYLLAKAVEDISGKKIVKYIKK